MFFSRLPGRIVWLLLANYYHGLLARALFLFSLESNRYYNA